MKRLISNIFVLFFMVLPLALQAQWSWDLEIPETASPPTIDGDGSDPAWNKMASFQPIGNHISGSIDDPSDFSAEFKAVWAGDTLYLLVIVTDDVPFTDNPSLWQNDNIEVFLDLDNSKGADDPSQSWPPLYDANDFQIMCPYNGTSPSGGVTIANSENTSGSYTMEIKIELDPDFGGYIQDAIGFDLQIDDCDGSDTREASICWHAEQNRNYMASEHFGTVSWTDRGNAIYEFATDNQLSETTIDSELDTVYLEVLNGADVTSIIPSFNLSSGASVTANGNPVVSGSTSVDFSAGPVDFTVTSGNGVDRIWQVRVVEAPPLSDVDIISFYIPGQIGETNIRLAEQAVDVTLFNGVDLSSLTADFELSMAASATVGGVMQESGISTNDFSSPVEYIVEAQDGTLKTWTVYVSQAFGSQNCAGAPEISGDGEYYALHVEGNNQWYKFIAPADGEMYISTCNKTWDDTQINVYSNCFGSLLHAEDNNCGDWQEQITIPVNAGQSYFIEFTNIWESSYNFDFAFYDYTASELIASAAGIIDDLNFQVDSLGKGITAAALLATIEVSPGASAEILDGPSGSTVPVTTEILSGMVISITSGDASSNTEYTIGVATSKQTAQPGTPIVLSDGAIDIAWAAVKYDTLFFQNDNFTTVDLSARFKTMANADTLYVLVDVIDDDIWNNSNENIEIYLDGDNSKPVAYENAREPGVKDFQIRFEHDGNVYNGYQSEFASIDSEVDFEWIGNAGGYALEIGIPWTSVNVNAGAGALGGFNVQVNDTEWGPTKKVSWSEGTNASWEIPAAFGTLEILASVAQSGENSILSSANGILDGTLLNVEGDVTAEELLNGLVLSAKASAELLEGGLAVDPGAIVTSSMTIEVTAENGAVQSYTIMVYHIKSINFHYSDQPPVIGAGTPDALWDGFDTHLIELATGTIDNNNDLWAQWKGTFDHENFYAIVYVKDDDKQNGMPNSWENDNVEFYFDVPNNNDGSSPSDQWMSEYDRQYRVVYNSSIQEGVNADYNNVDFYTIDTDTGYIVEIRIPWNNLKGWEYEDKYPANGSVLGFDVTVVDNDFGNSFEGTLNWSNYTSTSNYNNLDHAGDLTLTGLPTDFEIISPNGGETFTEGDEITIEWNSAIETGTRLWISYDNGNNWDDFEWYWTNPGNNSVTYTLTFGQVSNQCLIKVAEDGNSSNAEISDTTFTIQEAPPSIILSRPNTSSYFNWGADIDVVYQSVHMPQTVDIEYSIDGGTSWVLWENDAANSDWENLKTYTLPAGSGSISNALMRITDDYTAPALGDTSDPFTITDVPRYEIIYPNGGESFTAGEVVNIQFTNNGEQIDGEQIAWEISTNNGADWIFFHEIFYADAGTNYIDVQIDPMIGESSECLIRMSQGSNIDISDNVFEIVIPQGISCLKPDTVYQEGTYTASNENGLEHWFIYTPAKDTIINISTCGLTSQDTYLEIYTACGGLLIQENDDACDLQSNITMAVTAGQSYFILWKPEFTDGMFDWKLEYSSPEINISYPYQGSFLSSNTDHSVEFDVVLVDAVDIDFSIDGGTTWQTIASSYPTNLGYNIYEPWPVPNIAGDNFNCYIRITDSNDGSVVDLSEAFTISDGSPVRLLSPNGGETFTAGDNIDVSFAVYNDEWISVDISYDNGLSWNGLGEDHVDKFNNTISFSTNNYAEGSESCLIRYYNWDQSIDDTSDAVFTLLPRPAEITTIYNPAGSDYLVSGDVIDIEFETFKTDSVDIHYSLDGGATWTIIYDDEHISEGWNALSWTIPAITGINPNFRMRVSNAGDATVKKVTPSFTVAGDPPSITLVSPAGGEQITIGGEYTIEFEVNGPGTETQIYFSLDGTSYDREIAWIGANSGTNTFNWEINYDYEATSNAYVIIVSQFGEAVNATPFELLETDPSIIASAPWLPWVEGNEVSIEWESYYVDAVDIDFSPDGGATWQVLESNIACQLGWNNVTTIVPVVDSTLNNCKLRFSSAADPALFVITESFTVSKDYPAIKLISPNFGGEIYELGKNLDIITYNPGEQQAAWAQLSTDDGNSWIDLNAFWVPSDTATFTSELSDWIGLEESNNYIMRLVDYISGEPYDTTDNTFSIIRVPTLELYSDYEGETFVDWDWPWIDFELRKVDDITVEVSIDGGASWIHVKDENFGDGNHATDVELPNVDGTKTNCYLRISNSVDPEMYEITGPFTINDGDNPPEVTVIEPLAEAVYSIGEEVPIVYETDQWVDVDILFSDNNGLTWDLITEWEWSEPGTNTYYWMPDIDQSPSASCRIMTRVSWDHSYRDTSDVFELAEPMPSITVETPEQDEFLVSGELVMVEWSGLLVSEVDIDYSSDLGSTWTPVVSGIPSDDGSNMYFWTVADPGMYSENCMVRISDASDATVNGESEVFTISPDPVSIAVVDPNGGESFVFYESTTIEFNYNGLDTWVDISLSPDSGATWYDVGEMEAVRGLNQYEWDIYKNYTQTGTWTNHKLNAGDRFLIRLRIQDAPHIKDLSDDVFTLVDPPSGIDVMEPTTDSRWLIGDEGVISFGVSSVDSVDIHYSVDGGATWVQIADNLITQPEYNTYLWNIPANLMPTTNAKIKVVNSDNITVAAVSDAFTLTDIPPSITVLSPNGGENWTIGSTQTVEFELDASDTYVSVSVSYDNGNNWSILENWTWTETGIHTVEIETIDLEASAQALIRVDDYYSSLNDKSDAVFNIMEPPVELTMNAPVEGDIYFTGEDISLEWYSYNIDNVTLVLMETGVSTGDTLAKSILSQDGDNLYTTPVENFMVGGTYQVKIYDGGDPAFSDLSGTFTVQEYNPSITIVAPNGGEAFTQGDMFDLEFNNDGPEQAVIVSYSEDNGTTWDILDEVTAITGYNSISMMIPADATPTSTALMKVKYKLDATVVDVSNNPFTVVEAVTELTLTSPEEGVYLANDDNVSIDWTSINVDNVTIAYSTDGTTWSNIATGINAALGSYNWTVSGIDNVYAGSSIKIEDASNPTLSNAVSVILSDVSNTITVDAPNGGETFIAGDQMNVAYTNIGNATTVKLSISMNNGSTWMLLSEDNASANGSNTVVVNIPLAITGSTNCLVKVTDEQDAGNTDVSDNVFTVQEVTESITVDNPMTDDQWLAGEQYVIAWSSVGVDNIDIEYTTDAGSTWSTIVSSIFSADGDENAYNWTVPDPGTNETAQVRISNSADNTVNDLSGEFSIISEPQGITLSEPNGAENYQYGNDVDITFTLLGVNADVAIAVSDDNGTSWSTLASAFEAVVGENIYTWTPTETSDQYLVRVRLTDDFDVADTSDAVFAVNPSTNALLSELRYGGTLFTGLTDGTFEYVITLPGGTTDPPAVSAVAQSDYATIGYSQAVTIDETAVVTVTAQDETTTNTYTIDFIVPADPSTDATLSSILINGSELSSFESSVITYNVVLPAGTTETPVVNAVTNNSYATKVITQPASPEGTSNIVVTAEDGSTQVTYTLSFSVYIPSNNASLASLSVDATVITGFDASIVDYTYELPYGTSQVPTVDAIANEDSAIVTVTQSATVDGTATVIVEAADGTEKVYSVNFTIAAPSTDATLADLTLDGTTIDDFSSGTIQYTVELPYGTTTVPVVGAVANHANAIIVITQAESTTGTATVVVTAQDGVNTSTYTVNFSIAIGVESHTEIAIRVYPNPADYSFVIENEDYLIQNVYIFSSSGKLVKSIEKVNKNLIEIDCSEFAKGIHQVILNLNNGKTISKTIMINN